MFWPFIILQVERSFERDQVSKEESRDGKSLPDSSIEATEYEVLASLRATPSTLR